MCFKVMNRRVLMVVMILLLSYGKQRAVNSLCMNLKVKKKHTVSENGAPVVHSF